jgi:hypothetical protein
LEVVATASWLQQCDIENDPNGLLSGTIDTNEIIFGPISESGKRGAIKSSYRVRRCRARFAQSTADDCLVHTSNKIVPLWLAT